MASLYIRIYRNTLTVRNVDTKKEVTEQSETPFTTTRLLLGQMIPAMKLLDRLAQGRPQTTARSVLVTQRYHPCHGDE
nr:hypothetical protein [Pectobacterium carotovorum]